MKVCVVGLWHLGVVMAACLSAIGHEVIGTDAEIVTVKQLRMGHLMLYEPGLDELVQKGLAKGNLYFNEDSAEALRGVEIVLIAYDTPVDNEDHANVELVINRIIDIFPFLEEGTLVLISSQLPVGTTKYLEQLYSKSYPNKPVSFGYVPENLRLGSAIKVFNQAENIIVGVREETDKKRILALFSPLASHLDFMSIESAELTKHARNAFLATSIAFTNEIAALCECLEVDAKEVERGLKSDSRIGPQAYLAPGAAFSGGTLARGLIFLIQMGRANNLPMHLLSAACTSNNAHKMWVCQKLQLLLGDLQNRRIAIWGLTYKPHTNTLRRSGPVELCEWLIQQNAVVQIHDPMVKTLPEELSQKLTFYSTPLEALKGTVALVVATEWPMYQLINAESIVAAMDLPLIIDPNRFLSKTFGANQTFHYITVGKGTR